MKRALLIGYYGRQNAGDDAFLAVSAWGARTFLGVEEVWANTSLLPNTYGERVRPLHLPWKFRGCGMLSRLRQRHWLPRIQHVLFGGGSNFHSTPITEGFTAMVRAAGLGPHLALGVSVGPFNDPGAEGACAELFSLLTYVGVRDHASFERARKLAPVSVAVEQTFDVAPLLPTVAGNEFASPRPRNQRLAVSLCNYERFSGGDPGEEARRVEVVAQAIADCARRGVCDEVLLVDMDGHPEEGDAEVHTRLQHMLQSTVPVRHEAYTGDPALTMQLLSEARGVLAMRLHAAVFAFCSETPFAMLAYHEKCFEWMRAIGGADALILPVGGLEPQLLAQMLQRLMSEPARTKPRLSVGEALAASRRNWEQARQWLGASAGRLASESPRPACRHANQLVQ